MAQPKDLGRVVKASDTVTYKKVGPTMYEILWSKMDELLQMFYEPGSDRIGLQGEMRGIAFAIKEWSGNWYQQPNEIAKHAKRRYEAWKAGEEMPLTVGCDGYNPLPPSPPRGWKDISKPPVQKVSPEVAKQVKAGLAAGFPVSDLAAIYKIDMATVEALR